MRLEHGLGIPLFGRIAGSVRSSLVAGRLKPGERLPSVRQAARDLAVSPATVVHAYRTLEAEGLVERRRGSGTYVCGVSPTRRSRGRKEEAERIVKGMVAEAATLGLTTGELRQALECILAGEPKTPERPRPTTR